MADYMKICLKEEKDRKIEDNNFFKTVRKVKAHTGISFTSPDKIRIKTQLQCNEHIAGQQLYPHLLR